MAETTAPSPAPGSVVVVDAVTDVVVQPSFSEQFLVGLQQVWKKLSVVFVAAVMTAAAAVGPADVVAWVQSLPVPAWSVSIIVAAITALLAAIPQWGKLTIKKAAPQPATGSESVL